MMDLLINKKFHKDFVAMNTKKKELGLGVDAYNDIDPTMLLDYMCI